MRVGFVQVAGTGTGTGTRGEAAGRREGVAGFFAHRLADLAMVCSGRTRDGTAMEPLFDHDRLEVHQVARQFNRELCSLLAFFPRGHADSRNQLKRAGKSITRNIAEGSGKWTVKDKIHFFHIARGSATECAAELDSLVDYQAIDEPAIQPARRILSRVVAMLIGMIRSLEARRGVDMSAPTGPGH